MSETVGYNVSFDETCVGDGSCWKGKKKKQATKKYNEFYRNFNI